MTLYGFFFYLISAVVIVATAIAITRRNLVHAVVYLIVSYFGTAILLYLFGAPFLAALEVIIYAGAIMVLFLFVVMMIRVESTEEVMFPLSQWFPAAVFGLIYLAAAIMVIFETPGSQESLLAMAASPRQFAAFLFEHHWFSIEVISLLLLLALIGALQLAMGKRAAEVSADSEGGPSSEEEI
jgi:NADH-quinone oxidoreductase subunit J